MENTQCICDSFGRKINYARISLTDRCNMRCRYCMPEKPEAENDSRILSFQQLENIVDVLVLLGFDKIRLTGGEPLVRNGVIEFVEKIAQHREIKDLCMTTNGQLLEEFAPKLKAAGLKRINISLDTFDEKKFFNITKGGKLQKTLKGIEAAKKAGFEKIKINTVLIGGFNDDEIESFVNLTRDEAVDVRFIELMPIGECAAWDKSRFISNSKVLKACGELRVSQDEAFGAPARLYSLPNAKGRVGLINAISHKFCMDCNRIRFTCDGKIKNCLHSDIETDINTASYDKIALKKAIEESILKKPLQHHLENGLYIGRNMINIGG